MQGYLYKNVLYTEQCGKCVIEGNGIISSYLDLSQVVLSMVTADMYLNLKSGFQLSVVKPKPK